MRDLRLTDAHPCSKLQQQKISWRGLTEILPLLTFHMVPIQFGSFCYKHVDSASGSKQAHTYETQNFLFAEINGLYQN